MINTKYIIILGLFILSFNACAKRKNMVKIGQKAPDFCLQDENGTWRNFSEFADKKVVLYFYPKDETPGCTKEACGFRDYYKEYEKHHIIIIGINYDSWQSHKKFKEHHKLPFMLLSDPDANIAQAYGAYQGIMQYFFPKRITFLIDHGVIKHIINDVDVATHAQEIIKLFE